MQFAWSDLPDNELLKLRICDLHVRIQGSEVEDRVRDLHSELEARALPVRPDCYLADEWFSPEGSPLIAIPFYLAHPRLAKLERKFMREVEGGTDVECLRILKGRIISSHLKDLNQMGPEAHDVPFGTGVSDIPALLHELKEQRFAGNVSIEYEYNWENSTPEVGQCIGFVRGYGAARKW